MDIRNQKWKSDLLLLGRISLFCTIISSFCDFGTRRECGQRRISGQAHTVRLIINWAKLTMAHEFA